MSTVTPLSRRILAAVIGCATATLVITAATTGPAQAAGGLRTHLDSFDEYPDLPPGQNLGWIVMAVNESGQPVENVEVSIDLYEADGELPAVEAIESTQDAVDCDEPDTGRSFVCVIPKLTDEQNFDFELALRAGADRVNHGVTTAEAVIRVDGRELARDTATLDASLPLDPDRITGVEAPERVRADQVFGDDKAEGAPLSFTVRNDTDEVLHEASLFVETGAKTGIVPASDNEFCTYDASGRQLGCTMKNLGPGDERTYEFTLWAATAEAWRDAEPGRVDIDVVVVHNGHDDAWAHSSAPIALAEPGDGDGILPVTGFGLSTPLILGVAALLLGVGLVAASRRRVAIG